ncbi:MAG: M20/M25/M40 family metallo-hydrolase [Roseimicrobium sp.]
MPTDLAMSLLAWLPSQLPEALRWLERMVCVNSFTTNRTGVNEVGALTAECFAELGFRADLVPSSDDAYGSHLFLHRVPGEGLPVVLVTHLDTVFPPDEEARNHFHWEPAWEEARIYGHGTVDIKGGTVLIWMMLRALREFAPCVFAQTNWLIAANASEEVLCADFAQRTMERCPSGTQAVLVFEGGPREGGEWHIVTSRKGRAEYRLHAEGKGAHAGSAHRLGVNAIVGLCEAVQKCAALTDEDANLTVNVARVSGGTVTNRVPHEAVAELEMRAYEPAVLDNAGAAVLALSGQVSNGARISAKLLGATPTWPNGATTQALYAHWAAAAEEVQMKLKSVPRGGLSDANYLCRLGPTLDGLGPVAQMLTARSAVPMARSCQSSSKWIPLCQRQR